MGILLLAATLWLVGCGESEAPERGATSDPADASVVRDGSVVDAGDGSVADVVPGQDVSSPRDAGNPPDTLDGPDAGDDADTGGTGDAGTPTDSGDAGESDAGRTPGTVRLANYIGCDDDSECPTGTGNCLTSIPFNRTWATSPVRITIAELAPDWPRAGICSRSCSDQADACAGLRLPGAPNAAYTCQIIATGTPPYALVDGALPDPASLNPAQQTLGLPFAAVCLPPFRVTTGFGPDFCEPCNSATACEEGSVCWLNTPFAADDEGQGACLTPCAVDGPACPIGFACEALDLQRGAVLGASETGEAMDGTYCVPREQTCGACRDADGDGFGTGLCDGDDATPHDCDDTVAYTWFDATNMAHAFPLICGDTVDANCNGVGDVFEQIGTEVFGATHCTSCADACGGEAPNGVRVCMGGTVAPACGVRCTNPDAFVDCDGDPANGCETPTDAPSRVFYADCDGDGVPQDVWKFSCDGGDTLEFEVDGVLCQGIASNLLAVVEPDGEFVFDCDDDDRKNYPGNLEVCDGQDNDCNTVADDTPLLTSGNLGCIAPGVLGECAANGRWACAADGSGPGEVCVPAQPSAEVCDGLDNDCDGSADNTLTASGQTVTVTARPGAAIAGKVGDACSDASGNRVGVCADGTLICDSVTRELACDYNEPTAGPGPVVFEQQFAAGEIPAPFETSAPAWSYGCVEGGWCGAVSPPIGDNSAATLTLPLSLGRDGTLGFTYSVSSEFNYDFFRVKVDGVTVFSASGDTATFVQVPITAGERLVEFVYEKDRNTARGRDNVVLVDVYVSANPIIDWPDDRIDMDCDGFDGNLAASIFVGGLGAADSGTGTRDRAYQTLDYAIAQALASNGSKYQIHLQGNGEIGRQLDLPAVFGVFGGYGSGFQAPTTGRSTITIGQICESGEPPCLGSSASYRAGLVTRAPTDVRLNLLDISMETQAAGFGPAAVLACESACDKLRLTEVSLDAQSGAMGVMGDPFVVPALDGLPALRPSTTVRDNDTRTSPTLTCQYEDGIVTFREGGLMGDRGDSTYRSGYHPTMSPGSSGGAGDFGSGGAGGKWSINAAIKSRCDALGSSACTNAGLVVPGPSYASQAEGKPGADGASASTVPAVPVNVATPWAVLGGARGQNGEAGFSGGGGGGTATVSLYQTYDPCPWPTYCPGDYGWLYVGTFGESGATGACGGNGGRSGGAGGTVIGMVVKGTAFPRVTSVSVTTAKGGNGGDGGTGQSGGPGGGRSEGPAGIRATQYNTNIGLKTLPYIYGTHSISEDNIYSSAYLSSLVADAGRGGSGGDGGGGGGGGGGTGGWSIAVLTYGPTVPTGANAGIDFDVPSSAATGGAGGQGGSAGGDSTVAGGPTGRAGATGRNCQIWNTTTNTGVTCTPN